MLRLLTAGESHGMALVGVLEGLPSGVPVSPKEIAGELARRRHGHGRSGRQKLEGDRFEIVSGVRHGRTLGSPIAVTIENAEWDEKYRDLMAVEGEPDPAERLTRPRPGSHADRHSRDGGSGGDRCVHKAFPSSSVSIISSSASVAASAPKPRVPRTRPRWTRPPSGAWIR
jgi:hypothetical protein